MSDITITAAIAVWGVWEAVKVFGLPKALVDKLFHKSNGADLKKDDHDIFLRHIVSCEKCQECQNKQVDRLERIVENTAAIKTLMEIQTKGR